ncbi:hypothetical protein TrLO_g10851 [Triparma laevis f. longispina]|uniref:Ion transport domain-containing protein n=1 Tax=Triparma laevis f. longispina TaxID=1714387 RepID=A0A9W7FRF0_9STRA|nr:hypothetical protein TrLO_g10851 [Triparma laevis f. longispina]
MSLVAEELFWGLSLAIYFLLRELAQFWALFKLGVHMSWFDDYWNFIDVMASGGTIALCAYSVRNGPGPGYEQFASFVSIFVWLKLLGYMKAYSQSIATFVLMLSQILRDLRSFLGVLLIVIVMFGHAFYLVLSHTTIVGDKGWSWIWNHTEFNSTIYDATPNFQSIDGQDCWSDGWYDSSTQLVKCNSHYDQNATEIYFFANVTNSTTTNNFNDDMYEGDIDFSTVPSTAFSLYLMVLGNFEPAAITGLWANALFFFYSFLVFIILLNILIAIVSDSYDDVLVKSSELFWLSRTNLIAEITSTFGWALIEDGNANIAMRTWFLVLKFLGAFKDNLRIAYGVKSDHKCYLPLLIHSIYLRRIKGRGEVEKKGLDLSIESNSSDWSGRVLDIVKRVNKQTSSESSKTNEKIKHLTEDVRSLKKKLDESEKKREEMFDIMLEIRDQVRKGGEVGKLRDGGEGRGGDEGGREE